MASRASLNKVLLIGNLTRDPELRYTPSGAAVCTFGMATNRTYVASDGTKKEVAEFIKIVSWNKLAELCNQLLTKGRKVYVEGRLQTRSWETPDGQPRQTTEVVIDDMRILDSRKSFEEEATEVSTESSQEPQVEAPLANDQVANAQPAPDSNPQPLSPSTKSAQASKSTTKKAKAIDQKEADQDTVDLDELPF